jgi:hypothetical protein
MTIEEVKHADLQQAVKDINTTLGTNQNKVAGRQVLIDFIVGAIGGCIGPDPENPDAQIWTDERAGELKPETLATYEALTGSPEDPGTAVTEEDAITAEQAHAEAAGQPDPKAAESQPGTDPTQPKECPEFGKGYDAADPACAKPCKRAKECQTVMAEAAATAPGKKGRKTAEEKAAEKEAKKAEREAAKAQRAADKAAGKTTTRVRVEGPSNKQKVFASWKADQTKTADALGSEVAGAVKTQTIKAWIGSWKHGKNLPAGATA